MSWYKSWFNSPYYHLLYSNRSQKEADDFIEKLYSTLHISPNESILDLACGAGRHSVALAGKGNKVLGIDLAENSISEAQEISRAMNFSNLEFRVADMRDFSVDTKFDYILNLFTSFGYFENKSDNVRVIQQMSLHQNIGGIVVIDYLNSAKVFSAGNQKERKEIKGIEFLISKYVEKDIVYKEIRFSDQGLSHFYKEQVQLFTENELEDYFERFGYKLINHYGNYSLDLYSPLSDRSISIFRKL